MLHVKHAMEKSVHGGWPGGIRRRRRWGSGRHALVMGAACSVPVEKQVLGCKQYRSYGIKCG